MISFKIPASTNLFIAVFTDCVDFAIGCVVLYSIAFFFLIQVFARKLDYTHSLFKFFPKNLNMAFPYSSFCPKT